MAEDLLAVLNAAADAVVEALASHQDWGLNGLGSGQYHHDTVADAAAIAVLGAAGLGVFSEESGLHDPDRPVMVVLDPVDGSTNAFSRPPLVGSEPLRPRLGKARGRRGRQPADLGALRGGQGRRGNPQRPGHLPQQGRGHRPRHPRLQRVPAVVLRLGPVPGPGAAALDLCAVACGALDGFVDCSQLSLAPWDYMGGLLVCREAGVLVEEAFGRDLVVRQPGERRTIVAACTETLLDRLVEARRQQS